MSELPPPPLVCLVTDRRRSRWPLPVAVAAAVAAGVGLVQLREKDLAIAERHALAEALRRVVLPPARLVINGDLETALAVQADGLHLPEDAAFPARAVLPPDFLLGRSVHSLAGARGAWQAGVNYLILGTIFPTESKPGRTAAGLGLIRQVRALGAGPLIAIGGIDHRNLAAVLEAGADGVAVVGAILGADDPAAAAAQLVAAARQTVQERAWPSS